MRLEGFGRHAYGIAAILFGATSLLWHDLDDWPQTRLLGYAEVREAVIVVAAAAAFVGGFAIGRRRSARFGAIVLGVCYLVLASFWIPPIIHAPLTYDRYGNFFEHLAIVSGALITYSTLASSESLWPANFARAGRIVFGICVVSFMLEQIVNLRETAGLVPKWIPAGQTFWAIATTVAFALAAIAILSGWQARVAARLLTAMLLLFELLIWVPALFVDPHNHFNWFESNENLAIAATAWILTDYLAGGERRRPGPMVEALRAGEPVAEPMRPL